MLRLPVGYGFPCQKKKKRERENGHAEVPGEDTQEPDSWLSMYLNKTT